MRSTSAAMQDIATKDSCLDDQVYDNDVKENARYQSPPCQPTSMSLQNERPKRTIKKPLRYCKLLKIFGLAQFT